MFDQISIIGCGLIGSSIFKRLKKTGSTKKIITFDPLFKFDTFKDLLFILILVSNFQAFLELNLLNHS